MAEIGTPDQILRKSSKGQEYGLGSHRIKKCPKKWKKSPKRGGGSVPEIKKSTIQNVDFFL